MGWIDLNIEKNDDKKKIIAPPRKCNGKNWKGDWWGWMMRWEWERWDEGDGFLGMDGLEWSGKNLGQEVDTYLPS